MVELTLPAPISSSQLTRRASIRYRCDRVPTRRVFLLDGYQSLFAEVCDLSLGGVKLALPRPLPDGTLLFIDLMGMEVPVEFLARVVHASERDGGGWLVGCQFERVLSQDELLLILRGQK